MNIKKLLNLPRNLYLNIRIFGVKKGIIVPVLFSHSVKIGHINRNCIEIKGTMKRFMVEIGWGGSEGIVSQKGYFSIADTAKVVFSGHAYFAEGCVIRIDNGIAQFGHEFCANKNNVFWIKHGLLIGDNTIFGYNVYVRDDDGHVIKDMDGNVMNAAGSIEIGSHVWCASNVSILKNVSIGEDSVIGYGSVVSKCCPNKNALFIGQPAVVRKENITWEK